MAKPFYLIWQEGNNRHEGYDGANWIDGQLTFPIGVPRHHDQRRWRFSLSSSASVQSDVRDTDQTSPSI